MLEKAKVVATVLKSMRLSQRLWLFDLLPIWLCHIKQTQIYANGLLSVPIRMDGRERGRAGAVPRDERDKKLRNLFSKLPSRNGSIEMELRDCFTRQFRPPSPF